MTAQTTPTRTRRDEAALHEAVGHRVGEERDRVHQRRVVVEVALAARRLVVVVGVVEDEPPAVAGQDEDVAAVRLGKEPLVEDEVGRALGDEPAVEQRRLVESLGGADQVVGRGDDRLAGPRLGLEDVHQVLLGPRVDAGDRLVEQVQLGFGGDGPGEEDPAALAARQGADLAVDRIGHPDRLEGRRDPLAIDRAGLAPEAEPGVAAHHHDLADGDRELPVDRLRLRQVGDRPGRRRRAARRGP